MSEFKHGTRVWIERGAQSGMGSSRTGDRYARQGGWGITTGSGPDSDGDYYVIPEDDPEEFFYVHKNSLRLDEAESEDQSVSDVQPGVWVAYYQNDDGFSVVTAWASEIDALRYAVQNSAAVKYLGYGEELVP